MNKTQIVKTNNKELFFKCALISAVLTIFVAFAAANGLLPVLAGGNDATGYVLTEVKDLLTSAATIVGAVIAAWGIFQMILAFRREDSEGISKQITTVVVGALLIGFGLGVGELIDNLSTQV